MDSNDHIHPVSSDIFSDIVDLEENDFPIGNVSLCNLQRFCAEEDDGFDESELISLAKKGFSYYSNTLSEINSVPVTAQQITFSDPEIKKRALLEVLSAKQQQILNAFQKKELSRIEVANLTKSLSQARKDLGVLVIDVKKSYFFKSKKK